MSLLVAAVAFSGAIHSAAGISAVANNGTIAPPVPVFGARRPIGFVGSVYVSEKLTLTAVRSYRALGTARLMVLVGGLPTWPHSRRWGYAPK